MNAHIPRSGHPQASFDHLAALTNSRISNGYLRIPAPPTADQPQPLLWSATTAIAASATAPGCAYADIAMAILARYGISIGPSPRQNHATR